MIRVWFLNGKVSHTISILLNMLYLLKTRLRVRISKQQVNQVVFDFKGFEAKYFKYYDFKLTCLTFYMVQLMWI